MNGETVLSKWTVRALSIACILSNLSYYPVFQQRSISRNIVIAMWIVLVVVSLFQKKYLVLHKDTFAVILVMYIIFLANSGISYLAGNTGVFNNHFFRPVTTAILIMAVGYFSSEHISRENIRSICIAYSAIMSIISIPLFVFYLYGTDLTSSIYDYDYGKNEIAVLLLCGIIISAYLYKPSKKILYLFKFVGIAFMVLDIVFLRCRSVLLALAAFICIIIVFSKNVNPNLKKITLVLIGVCILFFLFNEEKFNWFMENIVFAKRDSSDINKLSSGRIDQIVRGLKVFSENIFIGVGSRRTLDCFYVSILANYGILSWPLLVMALIPSVWSFGKIKYGDALNIVLFSIAVGIFVVSVNEELAPFGPGTRCYILWLLCGIMIGEEGRSVKV